jgi:hypothetical protein
MVTVSQLLQIPNAQEPIPVFVKGSYLYISANRAGFDDGAGRIYKYDLDMGILTTLASVPGYSMWGGSISYVDDKIIRFGQLRDPDGALRSGVAVIDTSNDIVTTAYHPNTGDANEFIGVAYDYGNKRFIVGERVGGGGLWVIPSDGLDDYTKWRKVHGFAGGPEVTSVAVFRDVVYVALFRRGNVAKVVRASTINLTSWADVESSATTIARPYVDADDGIIAYGIATGGNYVVRWSTDGSSWISVTVAPVDTTQETYINVKIVGRYIFVAIGKQSSQTTDLYMVDMPTRTVMILQTDMSGSAVNKPFYYDGSQNLYMSTSGQAGSIYRIAFDSRRVLVLSVPASVNVGQTVDLVARLTDGVNPIVNALIEFYVVESFSLYSPVGRLIGRVYTDSNGRASVSYTVPPTATGKLIFAAVYRG